MTPRAIDFINSSLKGDHFKFTLKMRCFTVLTKRSWQCWEEIKKNGVSNSFFLIKKYIKMDSFDLRNQQLHLVCTVFYYQTIKLHWIFDNFTLIFLIITLLDEKVLKNILKVSFDYFSMIEDGVCIILKKFWLLDP